MHQKRVILNENKKWLKEQFWAGKRWVVLEMGFGIDRIHDCYSDYLDAAHVCKSEITVGKILRVRVLGSILKELNETIRGMPREEDRREVRTAIGKYPMRLVVSPVNWEEELLFGDYYPMVWLKTIHPLLAVRKYVVVLDGEDALPSRKQLYSTSEFPQAMLALEKFVRKKRDRNGILLLVGQLRDVPFDYHRSEFFQANSSIIFYRAEWRAALRMDIIQLHDPAQSMMRSIPMFVRYFAQRRELAFYDGKLKRIRPGDEPDFIDLSVFDFRKYVLKEELGYEAGRTGGFKGRSDVLQTLPEAGRGNDLLQPGPYTAGEKARGVRDL